MAGRKLKVYRTAIGFHDAYVAAPSQKAALEAWGSDADLFARGGAEIVTDAALTEAPLAQPGKVVKRLRGTSAEHLAALPPDAPKRKPAEPSAKPRSVRKPTKPRPKRDAVEAAERALTDAEAQHAAEGEALAERIAALERERRTLEARHAAVRDRLRQKVDRAKAAYADALRRWND